MSEYYTGEIAALINQFGYAETFRILQERKKQPAPEQGDASELPPDQWQAAIEANKRKESR